MTSSAAAAGATQGRAGNQKLSFRIGGQTGQLLHFFHGDYFYAGMTVKMIADALGPEQPILAIAAHGKDDRPLPPTIEQMAADRLAVVRAAQPHGPYLLGGSCNGALVAFETARLLSAAGERVDLVVMIDPIVVSVRPGVRAFLGKLDGVLRLSRVSEEGRQRARVWSWRKLWKLERWSYRRRHGMALSKAGRWSSAAQPAKSAGKILSNPSVQARYQAIEGQYRRRIAAYHPEPLDVPVLYFSMRYDGRAWKRISPRTEYFETPAEQHSTLGPEAAKRLRAQFSALASQPATQES